MLLEIKEPKLCYFDELNCQPSKIVVNSCSWDTGIIFIWMEVSARAVRLAEHIATGSSLCILL